MHRWDSQGSKGQAPGPAPCRAGVRRCLGHVLNLQALELPDPVLGGGAWGRSGGLGHLLLLGCSLAWPLLGSPPIPRSLWCHLGPVGAKAHPWEFRRSGVLSVTYGDFVTAWGSARPAGVGPASGSPQSTLPPPLLCPALQGATLLGKPLATTTYHAGSGFRAFSVKCACGSPRMPAGVPEPRTPPTPVDNSILVWICRPRAPGPGAALP